MAHRDADPVRRLAGLHAGVPGKTGEHRDIRHPVPVFPVADGPARHDHKVIRLLPGQVLFLPQRADALSKGFTGIASRFLLF